MFFKVMATVLRVKWCHKPLATLKRSQVTSPQGCLREEANAAVRRLWFADPLPASHMIYMVCYESCQQSIVLIFSNS